MQKEVVKSMDSRQLREEPRRQGYRSRGPARVKKDKYREIDSQVSEMARGPTGRQPSRKHGCELPGPHCDSEKVTMGGFCEKQ